MAVPVEFVQFEPNTRCDLRCPICPCTFAGSGRPAIRVDAATYRRVAEATFVPPYIVVFSGFSEATLNPDLASMAHFEKERGCKVFVASNGRNLADETIDGLLDAGIDQFVISLDAADEDTYAPIRAGAVFSEVIANILRLQDRIRASDSPTRIVLNAVVMKRTADRIPALIRFMGQHGLSDLALIKIMKMMQPQGEPRPFLDAEFLSWEEYEALPFRQIQQAAEEHGVRLMRSDRRILTNSGCSLPGTAFYISAEFDLSICPFLSFSEEHVLGNLLREPIEQILAGPRYQDLLARFGAGRWLPACESCACLFS